VRRIECKRLLRLPALSRVLIWSSLMSQSLSRRSLLLPGSLRSRLLQEKDSSSRISCPEGKKVFLLGGDQFRAVDREKRIPCLTNLPVKSTKRSSIQPPIFGETIAILFHRNQPFQPFGSLSQRFHLYGPDLTPISCCRSGEI